MAAAAKAAVQSELKRVEDEKRAEADRLADLQHVADEEEAELKAEAMQLKEEAEVCTQCALLSPDPLSLCKLTLSAPRYSLADQASIVQCRIILHTR